MNPTPSSIEDLDREIREVLDDLRKRAERETFRLVLRLEELMTTRTSLLLDQRDRAQSDSAD